MSLRPAFAAATSVVVSAALLAFVSPVAMAGPLGAGETVISGTTTAGGVGEAAVAAVPDGRTLAVWEGVRATANGHKREIFGTYLDAGGTPLGSPTLIARMGGVDDATQDAADPVLAPLSNGTVALAFAGDVKPDTDTTDRTNWQIFAAIIDPAQQLGLVTPTQLTSEGHDTTTPALSDDKWDAQYPDLTEDHGQLRLVWQADTADTGDGNTAIWTVLRNLDLTPGTTTQRVTSPGIVGTRPRVAALTDAGSVQDAMVVYQRVLGSQVTMGQRLLLGTTLGAEQASQPTIGTDFLMPDIAATDSAYAYTYAYGGTRQGVFVASATKAPGAPIPMFVGRNTTQADTWPTIEPERSQPGDFALAWARRTSTAGTGHYEVVGARLRSSGQLADEQQISSVDGNMSEDNAESLRPAIASHGDGSLFNAWARVRNTGGAGVAIRRTAASVDLTAGVTVTPARPSPARTGVNPADAVTVTYTYRNATTSHGSTPARITTSFPGFTASGAPTITATSGPTPAATPTPRVRRSPASMTPRLRRRPSPRRPRARPMPPRCRCGSPGTRTSPDSMPPTSTSPTAS